MKEHKHLIIGLAIFVALLALWKYWWKPHHQAAAVTPPKKDDKKAESGFGSKPKPSPLGKVACDPSCLEGYPEGSQFHGMYHCKAGCGRAGF